MNIQWFPGHMAKTRRLIKENLKLVDVVIELLDARIPLSSRNPEIDRLVGQKPRIIALNKSDLSDPEKNRLWAQYFKKSSIEAIYTNAITGTGMDQLKNKLKELTRLKTESAAAKGRIGRPVRTMVVGIPNVGKSAFINRIAGRASAQTGDKPGVTRTKQWVRINPGIQLLDTPGILWPKFEDPDTGLNLAFTGAIKDEIMDTTELAARLMERLAALYPDRLMERYKLGQVKERPGFMLLEEAGRNRGCLVSGGEVDLNRIAAIVLDEFRGGRIGKITLEDPPEEDTLEELP
ncbi:MAG TPA: ribosome biogenesis GTPase YlqF [Thermoclostridium sp.]|nr:ribosome biogenesis GTPase YlqF [Thermoclostridium sp.]HPU45948.1 ribosome biogenesis GTPase YlqF [Thermoclostridium sp.]